MHNPDNGESHTYSKPVDGRATAGVLFWRGGLSQFLLKHLLTGTQAAERSLLWLPPEGTHTVPMLVRATGWLWLEAGGFGLCRRLVAFQNRLSIPQWRCFLHLASCWCSHRSRDGRTFANGPRGFVDVSSGKHVLRWWGRWLWRAHLTKHWEPGAVLSSVQTGFSAKLSGRYFDFNSPGGW